MSKAARPAASQGDETATLRVYRQGHRATMDGSSSPERVESPDDMDTRFDSVRQGRPVNSFLPPSIRQCSECERWFGPRNKESVPRMLQTVYRCKYCVNRQVASDWNHAQLAMARHEHRRK